ncbi:unnamed protein product [Victoria cruziana]
MFSMHSTAQKGQTVQKEVVSLAILAYDNRSESDAIIPLNEESSSGRYNIELEICCACLQFDPNWFLSRTESDVNVPLNERIFPQLYKNIELEICCLCPEFDPNWFLR